MPATYQLRQNAAKEKRDPGGKFSRTGVLVPTERRNGKLTLTNGQPLPPHLAKTYIPPAWTDVKVNPNPRDKGLLVVGKDAKGRRQPIYHPDFRQDKDAQKFKRIETLAKQFSALYARNNQNRQSKDPSLADPADATHLIIQTGIRPGTEKETGADKQAFGATTLEGKHVVHDRMTHKTSLQFTGKKGVDLNIPVDDPDTAKMVRDRAKKAGPDGKLFPQAGYNQLAAYTKQIGNGKIKTKDYRTLLANHVAAAEIAKVKDPPANEKAYKKAVKDVATVVAQKLGNTPAIALKSYINPALFAHWRTK